MSTLLQRAIDLAKSGDRAGAEALLQQVVFEDPENEAALMWLSAVTKDPNLRREALTQAAKVNPQNPLAKKGITRFSAKKPSPPSAPPLKPAQHTPSKQDFGFDFGEEDATPDPVEATDEQSGFDFDFGEQASTPPPAPVAQPPADEGGFNFDFGEEYATPDPVEATDEQSGFDFDFDFGGESEISPLAIDPVAGAEADSPFNFDFASDASESPPTQDSSDDDGDAFDFASLFNTDEEASLDDLADEIAPQETPQEAPPVFDFGADDEFSFEAETSETPSSLTNDAIEPPAFDFAPEPTEASSSDSSAFDWNMFATGGPPVPQADDSVEEAEDSSADILSARLDFDEAEDAAIIWDEEEDEEEDDDDKEISFDDDKIRQQKQNRMLIIGTIIFSLIIISCCGIYYYFYEVADRFEMLPQLAPAEITVKARNPKNGVSTLKFYGFPASRARVTWTADDEAETCSGTTGVEVDFQNGEPPSRFNNRVCTAEGCSFDKELPPGPISKVTMTYICGEAGEITLFK